MNTAENTPRLKHLAIAVAIAAGTAMIIAKPIAQATADDYLDCLKGRNVNINLSPVYPDFMLNVGKTAAHMMNDQGLSADAAIGSLVREDMSPHLAEAIVTCSPKIGPVAPAGPASGSTCGGAGCAPNISPKVRQPCADVGRISQDATRNMLLVCDGPTRTWFMLPGMPRYAHHDAGTTCNLDGDNALSGDSNYLLTCVKGQWLNGTWR